MSKNQQNISEPLEKPVENQEAQEEQQAETVVGPSFESLITLAETPPYIKDILRQLNLRGLDFKSALEQIDNIIIGELQKNPESEVAKDLREYQTKINKLLNEMEKNEFTFSEAYDNLKEKAIDLIPIINAEIEVLNKKSSEDKQSEDKQINLIDNDASFEWVVDKDRPEGSFAFVQVSKKQENPVNYVYESGVTKEGKIETIKVRVISQEEKNSSLKGKMDFYYIEPEQIREIFNKLEPAVKKSILNGLKDQIKENKDHVKKLEAKLEKEPNQNEDLEKQITEEEAVQEQIYQKFKALE